MQRIIEIGIVDDRHAFLHGAAGEAIGVIVDRRGLADEQRVELGQARQVAAGDRLDLDAELLGHPRPVLDGGAARRRHGLLGVVEHGEGIARRGAVLLRAPLAGGVDVQRVVEEGEFARAELGDRHRREPADLRAAWPLPPFSMVTSSTGTAEPVEEKPAETVEAVVLDLAEIGQDAGRHGLVVGARPAPWPANRPARAAPGHRAGGRRDR